MTLSADIVVAGAGTAGMACAIAAADQGASVVVVEKAARVGGTLHVAGGHLSAAGTRRQAALGIDDHPDLHFAEVMEMNGGTANPEILRVAVDEAAPTIDWLEELGLEHGVESPAHSVLLRPYKVRRVHYGEWTGTSWGPAILKVLQPAWDAHVAAGRITCLLAHRLTGLLAADGGGVAGLRAEPVDGGAAVEVRGRAVVLATGGFAANPALMAELTPGAPELVPLAEPVNTGDGLKAALAVGARVTMADRFLINTGVQETEPGSGIAASRFEGLNLAPERPRREIWVNEAGERFVAEDETRILRRDRALLAQPGQRAWVILDDAALDAGVGVHYVWDAAETRARAATGDRAYAAATPEALALAAGIAPAGLAATVAAWNAACAAGADPLGRGVESLHPLGGPVLYALPMRLGATLSFGGLEVDAGLRVLGPGGVPIQGLYAAGEILGAAQTSGRSYSGGMLLTPALAFGRLLGRRLAGAAS